METAGRFERAIQLIDEANAEDPNVVLTADGPRPKGLVHAELLTEWVRRIAGQPSEALLLAARAHHIRRWVMPRASYPKGRSAYLQWRRDLHRFHADEAGRILGTAGYDAATIAASLALASERGRYFIPQSGENASLSGVV